MTTYRTDNPSNPVENRLDESPIDLETPASTCVVVPDATRPIDYESALRPLVARLADTSRTELLVATGLHRPMTDEELTPLRRITTQFDLGLTQHDATGSEITDCGEATALPDAAPPSLPVALNRRILDAERIICVGTVEPHQYAGFSGGIKAVSIGCAGRTTIGAMHGLSFLRDPRTTLGNIDDNPFQNTLWQIAESFDDREIFGLQLVPAPGGGVEDVVFDEVEAAFESACQTASRLFFETFDAPVDWLHLPVPAVKASNFYQASRAATYAALVDRPALEDGGAILVEAACPEKMGTGDGERACAAAMSRGVERLLGELRGDVSPPATRGGQQRAYVLARAASRYRIGLVGAPPIDVLNAMGIEQFDSVDEAVAAWNLDDREGATVEDVFHRIPRLGG